MRCNALAKRRPFRNLSPFIPQFVITSTTKDISSHETTLREDVKLHLSSGSKFLLHKPPHLIGKLRRARVCLTAPANHFRRARSTMLQIDHQQMVADLVIGIAIAFKLAAARCWPCPHLVVEYLIAKGLRCIYISFVLRQTHLAGVEPYRFHGWLPFS